jgi:hypothetical protein
LTIVTDGKQGLEALRFDNKAPVGMLIELMPGILLEERVFRE